MRIPTLSSCSVSKYVSKPIFRKGSECRMLLAIFHRKCNVFFCYRRSPFLLGLGGLRSCSQYWLDALLRCIARYPGLLYVLVFDYFLWISYGCRFYIDFKNVIATLVVCFSLAVLSLLEIEEVSDHFFFTIIICCFVLTELWSNISVICF